ncbi:hypothetical protein BurJ1DRAFT_2630 [Burkholderiales bacterium JOSHI_001]|nr:hypothetical protein BurJ1DRAFT_2630 [Burkholderiales bacterium JOSHI_001]
MRTQARSANPFALMMDPQAVLDAVEHSERLGGLKRRVCRPLDKPLIPKCSAEQQAFDQSVDADDASDADFNDGMNDELPDH